MGYEYRYINKNVQPSNVSYSLLIENTETKELIRIEKSFKFDKNSIDSEFLRAEAKKEIERITQEKNAPTTTEIPPEEADSE